jgi:hypothetical protein
MMRDFHLWEQSLIGAPKTCNTKGNGQSAEASRKHNRLDVQGNRIEAARWVEHHHSFLSYA